MQSMDNRYALRLAALDLPTLDTAPWTTLRVDHTPHNPDDDGLEKDIGINRKKSSHLS